MIDHGKHNVAGVEISAIDYDAAVNRITSAAMAGQKLAVSALAVHGVMTGVQDEDHRARLNTFDLLVPDGQPVRWALNLLHGTKLSERVYGPELTLRVCADAAAKGLKIYLYGSQPAVLEQLQSNLQEMFPSLQIAGATPSRFRTLTDAENTQMVSEIIASGADILFVGLGCPRQEVFTFENATELSMPVLAVGAAFDFHAGLLSQAPAWMQKRGLEWLYRFSVEPKRLWRRYVYLNPLYCFEIAKQYIGMVRTTKPPAHELPRINYG